MNNIALTINNVKWEVWKIRMKCDVTVYYKINMDGDLHNIMQLEWEWIKT